MFTNFEELHKHYGFDNDNKSRTDLTIEEEKRFVQDCFDTYEKLFSP